MTVYKQFRCNLCTDYIKPTDGNSPDGFGLDLIPTSTAACQGLPRVMFRRVTETELHLCQPCAKAIHDEMRKVMPAPVVKVMTQS